MGSIKYPFALFEIEESEDKCIIVSCFYDKLKVVLTSLKSAPIVFVGVTEKWYQTKQARDPFISPHILQSVKDKLSDGSKCSSKSSIQLSIQQTSSNDSKQTIWLWGPPIETVSQINGGSELVYVCLVSWISNQEINADTISEFGTKSVLLSICSRICEVTRGNISAVETGIYDYLKHLRESDYSKQYANILIDSFVHVTSGKKSYHGYLKGQDLPRCRIIPLMDKIETQFNIPEISEELADLTQLVIKKIRLKKLQECQPLNVENVEDLLRSCVAAANSKLYFDALPTSLVSYHERMETDENLEDLDPGPTTNIPIVKETVPVEQVKREHFEGKWKDDKLSTKIAQDNRFKIQQAFQSQLNDWVTNIKTLDGASEKEFKNLKRKFISDLSNDHDPDMLDAVVKNFRVIFQTAQEYIKEMSNIFAKSGYLSNDSLDASHKKAQDNVLLRIDDSPQNTKTIVNQACHQLYKVIKGHNETILKHQHKIVRQSKSEVINMYTAELQRIRKEKGPFPPKLFQKLSQALFMRCMAAFTKSTEYKGQSLKNNEDLKNELDDLAKKLMSLAEKQAKENKAENEIQEQKTKEMEILKENERKVRPRSQTPTKSANHEVKQAESPKRSPSHQINRTRSPSRSTSETKADKESDPDKLKAKIKSIVQEHQTTYREQFKRIINSPDLKFENIRKEHVEVVRKTNKLFEMDVRNKVGGNIDVKKVWQSQMHSELEKVYKIFKEAKQERKSENEEFQAKRNTNCDDDGGKKRYEDKSGKDGDDDDLEAIKSPLVFQITEQKIGMAFSLNGKPSILTNKKNEKWTLNLVGQTHKGKMIYGDEVNEQAASQRLRDKWEVGKMIEDGNVNRVGLFINNAVIFVRVEILLGFILKKLKIEAEKMVFHRDIKTCVICIPFFYISMQRLLVVDSARVAGFETVQLLNDISALAYEYAVNVRKRPPEGVFMGITESSKNIQDVALYKYESGVLKGKACVEHQVRMLSHVASYHEENDSLKDFFSSAWKQIKSIFTYKEMNEETLEQTKKSYKLMYSVIMQYHDNVLHKDCKRKKECVADILENSLKNSIIACRPGYAKDIQEIILNISGKQPELGTNETMLQGAARLSSQNPKKIGHSVLDLLSSSLWLTSGGNKMALGKGVELTRHGAKFHITSQSNDTLFFQKLFGVAGFEVLSLKTKFVLSTSILGKSKENLRIYFGVKNDGIFFLSSVELMNSDSNKKIRTLLEKQDYETRNVFLKKHDIKHYRNYVVDLFKD